MATITSIGSGLWSAAGTWDAGVPLDNDKVIIAAGHTVTFDVNQSAWATGVDGITVTGILEFSRIPGTYHLMLKAAATIGGTGVVNVGTLVDPIPFSAKHTITTPSGGWSSTSTLSGFNVYCVEPTIVYVRLSQAEILGATVLNVDTDVTGDIWAIGDEIYIINDCYTISRNVETRTIANITGSTITITAGLSSAKRIDSYIALITRHVKFLNCVYGVISCANPLVNGGQWVGPAQRGFFSTNITVTGGTFNFSHAFHQKSSISISGGVFYGNGQVIWQCANIHITGGFFATGYLLNEVAGAVIDDGIFTGYYQGILNTKSVTITGGNFWGNAYLFYTASSRLIPSGFLISGGTFRINPYGQTLSDSRLYFVDDIITDGADNYRFYNEHFDIGAVPGAYKAMSLGGNTYSQVITVPSGFPNAYQLTLSSSSHHGYWKKSFTLAAGETALIQLQLRKDVSMAYLPRVYLMKGFADPLGAGSVEQSFVMSDSVDVWESEVFSVVNNTTLDEFYTLWFVGKNAANNFYSACKITTLPDTTAIAAAVWTYITRELTTPADYKADVSALATSAELAALNDLDAAGIRAAVGLALANIDQQFLNTIAWQAINLDESITEGEIIQIRGSSWTIAITDLTLSSHKQQFAIKCNPRNAALSHCPTPRRSAIPDADSIIFADSDTGLLYLNGILAADPTLGTLAYVGTTLTLTLDPSVTAQLPPGIYTFGIQSIDPAGLVSEPYGGTFTITADVVRSIT